MPDDLKELYMKQEKERHKLRLRHRVEQVNTLIKIIFSHKFFDFFFQRIN